MRYDNEWKAGLGVGLMVGLVVGWLASTWPGLVIATDAKNWWDIGTAVGTIAIAAAMAWLTYQQYRAAVREKARRAAMALARIKPELYGLRQASLMGAYVLSLRARVADGNRLPAWQVSTLKVVLDSIEAPLAAAMDDLAFDESDRGTRLAQIVARIPDLRKRLTLIISIGEVQPVGGDIQAYVAFERLIALGRALDFFLNRPPTEMFSTKFHEALRTRLHLNDVKFDADEL